MAGLDGMGCVEMNGLAEMGLMGEWLGRAERFDWGKWLGGDTLE